MIDKTMFSDRRGRRSLQGQQVACSQIIKDNQFNFFVQSNFPRKETTSLACAHNPPVVCADSPLYTKGPWLCIISTQQRKTKIVLWKCSILFGKNMGRENVGTGVPDGPPLAYKFHQTFGRRFQQNSKKFGRVPNLFALTGDAGACGTPAMSN